MRIYLLPMEELREAALDSPLGQEALAKVDSTRREKIMRLSQASKQKVSLVAGLLLQYAVQEYLANKAELPKERQPIEGANADLLYDLQEVTLQDILSAITTPWDFAYTYGGNGKPYFAELPIYFNLSHSGDYVLCAVADVEVGADIQRMESIDYERIASRFFSEKECEVLRQTGAEKAKQLFYQLWTRKEAYGKLTGEGLGRVIAVDRSSSSTDLVWKEYDGLEGYSIAVCWKRGQV